MQAVFHELRHHAVDRVDRHGEADPDAGVCRRLDRGVNPYEATGRVEVVRLSSLG